VYPPNLLRPEVSLPYAQNPAPAFPVTLRAGSGHCAQGRKRDPRLLQMSGRGFA